MPGISQREYSNNLHFMSTVDKYNQYIYDNIRAFLGEYILDVGCGVGNITRYFSIKKKIIGIDNTPEFVSIFKENCKNAEAIILDIASFNVEEKLKDFFIDTIVMTNVLEHIKDDLQVLEKFYNILSPSGKIILVLPAHKWLFGVVDKHNLHYCRYTVKGINNQLNSVGFKILSCFQFNALGIPWWFVNGRVLKHGSHDKKESWLINKIIPLVRFIDKITFNKVGLSLVVIAEKPVKSSFS